MNKTTQIALRWLTGEPEWVNYVRSTPIAELDKDVHTRKARKAINRLVSISNTGKKITERDKIIELYGQFINLIKSAENQIDTNNKREMQMFIARALGSGQMHENTIKAMCILYDIRQVDVFTR